MTASVPLYDGGTAATEQRPVVFPVRVFQGIVLRDTGNYITAMQSESAKPGPVQTGIQLFTFPTSPYSMKVGCYLAYKKLDYELVGVSPITFKQVEFTGSRQVPVLSINGDWKLESSEIGIWLDEKFPQRPLLPQAQTERDIVFSIDQWISDQLIPTMFRAVVDWPSTSAGFKNGWKLSNAVNESTPMPWWVRKMWPVLIRKAPFIVAMVNEQDRTVSLKDAQQKLVDEFITHLADGPFLGGMQQPTLADLSAYPVVAFPYRFGLQGDADWRARPLIASWIKGVEEHLPENPFLVGSELLPGDRD